jgi:hypothetical protein
LRREFGDEPGEERALTPGLYPDGTVAAEVTDESFAARERRFQPAHTTNGEVEAVLERDDVAGVDDEVLPVADVDGFDRAVTRQKERAAAGHAQQHQSLATEKGLRAAKGGVYI